MQLGAFHPAVQRWFEAAFDAPTAAQTDGWEQIAAGRHTLIEAPTGSGKTLAAFLWCLNDLVCRPADASGVQVLYISPLKALNNDIQRNLEAPLAGIRDAAAELGMDVPDVAVGVRTGDTPNSLRQRQVRRPPRVFITTPESLYLLLTARKSQGMFHGLRYVILDEIHAIASSKRGVHLALSLERLEELAGGFTRIGLSATQRPLELVARLLGGYDDAGQPRPVSIVRAQQDKRLEVDLTFPFASSDEDVDFMHHAARLVLDEAAKHRSTLVFCNARHVTERLSEVLNQEAGHQVAVAHHGSLAKERRLEIEQALKSGELPLLIATSSLELGIDVGSVDMVIQLGSTKSVSRALQRIGRAGHQVGAVSRGRIVAQHTADLLDAAAGVRGLRRRAIEPTHVPNLCLDVLSQQVVAMAAAGPCTAQDVLRIAHRSHPYRALSAAQLDNVLAMLAGRYADVRFEGLKPRIEWDAETGEIRPLPGALRLAVINGGTIPDRGYMAVELMPGAEGQPGKKLGELDEEFAAELYVGGRPAFSLGTSVWAVEAVERDRVLVRPAPGEPYQIPFWRGDKLGRTIDYGVPELTRDIGAQLRRGDAEAAAWLQAECCLDAKSALALLDHVRRQSEATGHVPDDRSVVVEAFQDEIGDWRVVIHSLFGQAVNGAWAFALKPRLRETLGGIDPLVLHNDNGIIMRLPPIETAPLKLAERLLGEVRADTVEELLLAELADAPMLGLRFREAAQRALLLPKPRPDRRTPLWLRRQRSADLLAIVRRKAGFPALQEAVRECLHDTWDLNGLRRVLRGLESGAIGLSYVSTPTPSPFAGSLVWDFGLDFGEADDAPRGECRAAYLALNRDLLRETLEAEDLRQLLDPAVLAEVEAELAASAPAVQRESAPAIQPADHAEPGRAAAPAPAEPDRAAQPALAPAAQLAGHAAPVLAVQSPGVPATAVQVAHLQRAGGRAHAKHEESASADFLQRIHAHMQTRGPRTAAEVAAELALPLAVATRHLNLLVEASQLSCGDYRPGGSQPDYCAPLILARLHRDSLRRAREQIAPVSAAQFAAFLPAWQGVGAAAGARHALEALLHLPLTREQWQSILATRLGDQAAEAADAFTSRGAFEWRGASKGRIELAEAGTPAPAPREAAGFGTQPVLALLRRHGALFATDVARRLARTDQPLSLAEVQLALELLEDAGLAANDLLSRAGRWSIVDAPPSQEGLLEAYAEALLRRYGVVSREVVRAEKAGFSWSQLERLYKLWEWRGRALRGDFVRELSGPQFARREAVDLLREPPARARALLLAWEDPANAWGRLLPLSAARSAAGDGRPRETSGTQPLSAPRGKGRFVVLLGGQPLLTIAGWGRDLQPGPAWAPEHAAEAAHALCGLAGCSPGGVAALERWQGGSILMSPLAAALREAGFARSGIRLVRRRPADGGLALAV